METLTDFKNVLLSEIHPDPNQPRKFYDDTAMAELTQSIKEKGVLQPILIRPNGLGYKLVCGERRYRASSAAGQSHIPAVIRELSDDEALELQIIENLQRKDVHPMEEAVAFKILMHKGKDIKEIAARVGKSEFYARQRLKLNTLNAEWQQAFYSNRINVSEALKIAMFDEKIQAELYKSEGGGSGVISLNDWRLSQFRGDLKEAAFDLKDPTLDKKMGACLNCAFNSATSSLFPDVALAPKCLNVPCFKNKTDVHFSRELEHACEDPTVVFIHYNHGRYTDKSIVKLEKAGHKIYDRYQYDEIHKPLPTSWERWLNNNSDDHPGSSDVELMKIYEEEELVDNEKEIADYEKKIAGGKYKKAFCLTGKDRGKYLYVTLTKIQTASSKKTKDKEKAGDLTVVDIDEEIKRMQDRHKRSKELDGEKVHAAVVIKLRGHECLKKPGVALTTQERGLMYFLIFDHADYQSSPKIRKELGLKERKYQYAEGLQRDFFAKFQTLTDTELAFMIRTILIQKFGTSLPQHEGGTALRLLAESLGDIDIATIENEQQLIAGRRQEKFDKRIAELQAKRKELKTSEKPAKELKSKSKKAIL